MEARACDVMAGGGGAAGPPPDVRHQPPGDAQPTANIYTQLLTVYQSTDVSGKIGR